MREVSAVGSLAVQQTGNRRLKISGSPPTWACWPVGDVAEYLADYEGMARIKQFEGSLYYVVKGARKWEF
jgi:hypothetical protein